MHHNLEKFRTQSFILSVYDENDLQKLKKYRINCNFLNRKSSETDQFKSVQDLQKDRRNTNPKMMHFRHGLSSYGVKYD